jgi:hypothetical protein
MALRVCGPSGPHTLTSEPGVVIDLPAGATTIFGVTGPRVTVTQLNYMHPP